MFKLIYLTLIINFVLSNPLPSSNELVDDNVDNLLCSLGVDEICGDSERDRDIANKILDILNAKDIEIEQTETENIDIDVKIDTEEETRDKPRNNQGAQSSEDGSGNEDGGDNSEGGDNSQGGDSDNNEKDDKNYKKPKYGKKE